MATVSFGEVGDGCNPDKAPIGTTGDDGEDLALPIIQPNFFYYDALSSSSTLDYNFVVSDNGTVGCFVVMFQQAELNAIAKKNGFKTMQDMGQDLLLSGDLSFAEYERVLQSN